MDELRFIDDVKNFDAEHIPEQAGFRCRRCFVFQKKSG
jgi:hypothetical protein